MATGQSSLFAFVTGSRLVSVLLPCLLLLAGLVDAQHRNGEVRALLSFRDAYHVNPNSPLYWKTWNESNLNPCAWVGVTCTTNYTVEELNLSGWGLDLIKDLAILSSLPDLHKLDCSSNYTWTFPDNLSTLSGLTWLDFSWNSIHDIIPEDVSTCRNLRFISLQQNALFGEIPTLLGLVNLQVLLLGNNELSGSFPKALGELTTLVSIDLSSNLLQGSIPALPNLIDLVELTLDNNSFTEFQEPWSLSAKSLKVLSVSFNKLGGVIPPSIGNLSNLFTLNMSVNLLSGIIPSEFTQLMKNIYMLDLSQNQLTGGIPANMLQTGEENLVSLNLSYNRLSGSVSIDGTKKYSFPILDLSYNKLNGTLPLNLFSNASFLVESFWLQNNYIHGDITDVLNGPSLANIGEFQLQNSLFTGDLSRASNLSFQYLRENLALLDLSNNDLRWSTSETSPDPIRDTLATLTASWYLQAFRVGGNNFSRTSLPTSCFVDKLFQGFGGLSSGSQQ